MKTLLAVDDDPVILSIIGLLGSEELELLTASDGREALEILARRPVDLLVTDLYMPGMNGFELLAHMVRDFAEVPVIVMSAYEVPWMGDEIARKAALRYLQKPFDYATLAAAVHQALARAAEGDLKGISLLGFLRLLNLEKESYCLSVRSERRAGRLHVSGGELFNADLGRLEGEPAALEILSWDDCEIDVDRPRDVERRIDRPLEELLLEAG